MDKRRRQYVAIGSQIAFTSTGTKLLDKWGMEGLCTWMLYLAACKREMEQGVFAYTSEDEAWMKIGARASEFTVDEFFKYTGSLKQTSKRRVGRINYVTCTHFLLWNDQYRTQLKAEQKSRKTPPIRGTLGTQKEHDRDTEYEYEYEYEREDSVVDKSTTAEVREIYDHWRTVCQKTDSRYDRISDARRQKIKARLKEFTADELKRALDGVASDPWDDRRLHDDLVKVFRSQEQVDRFLSISQDTSLLTNEERLKRHFAPLKEAG